MGLKRSGRGPKESEQVEDFNNQVWQTDAIVNKFLHDLAQ